jgi:hypothetical protein
MAAHDPGNLATALNFANPQVTVAKLPKLPAFTPEACAASATTTAVPGIQPAALHRSWEDLAQSEVMASWASGGGPRAGRDTGAARVKV